MLHLGRSEVIRPGRGIANEEQVAVDVDVEGQTVFRRERPDHRDARE